MGGGSARNRPATVTFRLVAATTNHQPPTTANHQPPTTPPLPPTRYEIEVHGIEHKRAELICDDGFRMRKFGAKFDFCIGVSLFTHLPMNHILRCLIETAPCLAEGGQFYATFFLCEEAELLNPVHQPRGGAVTNFDSDPYHYTLAQIEWMAGCAGLTSEHVEWPHPRSQRMVRFTRRGGGGASGGGGGGLATRNATEE